MNPATPSTSDSSTGLQSLTRQIVPRGLGSLTGQILLASIVVTVIPLAVVVSQARAEAAATERRSLDAAQSLATAASLQVGGTLGDIPAVAETLALLDAFWAGDDPARDAILAALVAPQRDLSALIFFTPDYQQHGASQLAGSPVNQVRQSYAERAYAREAVTTGRLAFADQAIQPRTPDSPTVIPVALPIHRSDTGSPPGYLIASLSLDGIPALWSDLRAAPGSVLSLVDTRTGKRLATTDPVRQPVNTDLSPAWWELLRSGRRAARAPGPEGDLLAVWSQVPEAPWIVTVEIPAAAVLGPIEQAARERMAINVGATALALLVLFVLWRRLAPRLRALTRRGRASGRR